MFWHDSPCPRADAPSMKLFPVWRDADDRPDCSVAMSFSRHERPELMSLLAPCLLAIAWPCPSQFRGVVTLGPSRRKLFCEHSQKARSCESLPRTEKYSRWIRSEQNAPVCQNRRHLLMFQTDTAPRRDRDSYHCAQVPSGASSWQIAPQLPQRLPRTLLTCLMKQGWKLRVSHLQIRTSIQGHIKKTILHTHWVDRVDSATSSAGHSTFSYQSLVPKP